MTASPNQSPVANGLSAVRSGIAGVRERAVHSTAAAEAVAGRGVDFDFHTQVLPHWRRPVCRFNVVAVQAALGLSVSRRG